MQMVLLEHSSIHGFMYCLRQHSHYNWETQRLLCNLLAKLVELIVDINEKIHIQLPVLEE